MSTRTNTTLLVVAAILCVHLLAAPAAAPAADPDLRAQWHLDEGATTGDETRSTPDSSGNGPPALVKQASEVPGRFQTAFRVSEGSFVHTGGEMLRPEHLTAVAWVRRDGNPGPSRYVLSQGSGTCSEGSCSCVPSAYAMYTSYPTDVNAGGLRFYVNPGEDAFHAPGVPAERVWDGRWHMVAGTFDGAKARFYLDGAEIGDGQDVPGPIDYATPQTAFRIGRQGPYLTETCAPEVTSFSGEIDEVRIYGRALTADEIAVLAGAVWTTPPTLEPPPPPPPADTTAPTTTIAVGPPEPAAGGYFPDQMGLLVSATDDASAVETRCALDPLDVPQRFEDLPGECRFLERLFIIQEGTHTMYAASRDAAGNVEQPVVSRTFRVLRTPRTTIDDGPSGDTWERQPAFAFTTPLAGSTFECRIDDGEWTRCVSPHRVRPVPGGPHTFSVRATSPAGATELAPPSWSFNVYATTTESADCEVNPVTHWLIGPRPELLGGGAHFACLIGRIPASGCPAGRFCIDRDLVCPRGARCTVTTRAVWYDDDANARQGAQAFASVGLPKSDDYGHRPGDWRWNEWEDRSCSTGLDGARCSVSARYSVLGDDFRGGFGELQSPKTRPLYGACSWMPGGDGALANARFGPEEARRLTCAVTVEIQPATPLLALAKGLETVISVPSAGNLVATWLLAGGPTATAAAATRSRPHIASARLAVAEGGVVRLVPRLNAAARRRLRRNKRLPVVLRVEFTPKEGAPIVRTQRLTLKRVARPHRGRRSR